LEAGELNSFAIEANSEAMLALADAGLIQIVSNADGRVIATVLPEAEILEARLMSERDKDR
jgi:hypothetical protein